MTISPPTEAEIRSMRDRVYETTASDECWADCRENWLRPDSIKWLQQMVSVMDSKTAKGQL
jgi:hypothetical protein